MAICRIYLCTYRRDHLLPRALNSLLAQTVTDWVCELHNDDPENPFPRELVQQTNDPRIQIVDHSENLGPIRTFNLIFKPVPEQFITLLEDDNWWEPNFLETMLLMMDKFPEVSVAWANMRLWQEENDATWTDTKKNIWNRLETDQPELFYWPHKQQIMGALHSNGAMMVRSRDASNYVVPDETLFSVVEQVRERSFTFPILFVPQVLANFAITQQSSRPKNQILWIQMQTLLAGSFFKNVPLPEDSLREIWLEERTKPAKATATLFFVSLVLPECRHLLKYAAIQDWLFFLAYCLKHPLICFHASKSISLNKNVWDFLDKHTALSMKKAPLAAKSQFS